MKGLEIIPNSRIEIQVGEGIVHFQGFQSYSRNRASSTTIFEGLLQRARGPGEQPVTGGRTRSSVDKTFLRIVADCVWTDAS
jgi:hypothetical protein